MPCCAAHVTDLPGQPGNVTGCIFCYSRLKKRVCADQLCKPFDVVRISMCWAAKHIAWMP
jgi:hypothetical protein